MDHETDLERIKHFVAEAPLTLKAFAREAGVPYTTVHALAQQGWKNKNLDRTVEMIRRLRLTAERLSAERTRTAA